MMTEKRRTEVWSAMSFTDRSTTLLISSSVLTSSSNVLRKLKPLLLLLSPVTCGTQSFNSSTRLVSTLLLLASLLLTQLNFCSAQKVFKSHLPTNIVIPHIKYGQGLNRWSFLSVDRDNHGLHSDLLCPNPMFSSPGGASGRPGVTRVNTGREGNKFRQQQQKDKQDKFQNPAQSKSLPNEIWAVKTEDSMSLLPCSLRQFALPSPPFSNNNNNNGNNLVMMNAAASGGTRHNNGHYIENRILFINVSLVPFNFRGATPCTKYIKLMYDEEEGANLRCGEIQFESTYDNKYHIEWPAKVTKKRNEYFSLLENLERFLQNEQTFHRQFYFQIYFTSSNGRSKRCAVQQYELDLSYPAGNARFCNLTRTGGHQELCGEFHCDDLIFPLFSDHEHGFNRGPHDGKNFDASEPEDDDDYDDDDLYEDGINHEHDSFGRKHHPKFSTKSADGSSLSSSHAHNNNNNDTSSSWTKMLRMDIRLLIFVTVVPLVLFGILIFGLELIVYFMCCRKRRGDTELDPDRSHQLLQNSLNVWENVPSREAQRTVSFSPMTTNVYAERKHMLMDAASLQDHPETPKILKSALKKPGEHSSPTTGHHYFEYDHDMPPSYIETTTR